MKSFRYSYESTARFSQTVRSHSFLLRAIPFDDEAQVVHEAAVRITSGDCRLSESRDIWGSELRYGILMDPHSEFSYMSSGTVTVTGKKRRDPSVSPLYLVPSSLADYIPEMAPLLRGGAPLESAMDMAKAVKEALEYSPGSTGTATKASEAFLQHKGVCQDFSHVLIALCRRKGIPARYVCGFFEGEGETHAWTEIWSDGEWTGLDPTAGELCDDRYIAIARGRDAADCPVNRGVFTGSVMQTTATMVKVKPIEEQW